MKYLLKLFVIPFYFVLYPVAAEAGPNDLLFENLCSTNERFQRIGDEAQSCQELKDFREAVEVVGMALLPASTALTLSGSNPQLLTQLSLRGLGMANPAVLGVTVIGAIGVTTVYIITKAKMKECIQMDRQLLEQQISTELVRKYQLQIRENTKLEINQ